MNTSNGIINRETKTTARGNATGNATGKYTYIESSISMFSYSFTFPSSSIILLFLLHMV